MIGSFFHRVRQYAKRVFHPFDRFIETQFSSEVSFEVPDDALQRFPEAVRSFFRPSASSDPSPV